MKIPLRRIRRALPWVLVLGGLATVLGVKFLKPIAVHSVQVSRGAIVVEALGTGSVESRKHVDVGFELTGRVVEVLVDQGDTVVKGQRLASIDDRTFRAEVALAELEIKLTESTLRRLTTDIARAEAILAGAEIALKRVQPLVERGAVAEGELDVADERYKVASAELSRAEAAQFEGQATIEAARSRLERARTELERTVVESPVDGIVLHREREVGDVAVPGAAVLRIASTDTVWASVWVDETYLDALALAQPVRIALRSSPDRSLPGKVARIGREVDRETRELLVDVSFDELPTKLAFGQRVDLWIELARRDDVVRIPAGALFEVDGRMNVLVAEGGKARLRPLELGRRGREFVEVTEGLDAGDVVLDPHLSGNRRLKAGRRVKFAADDPNAGQEAR